jgi:hypothetical protein
MRYKVFLDDVLNPEDVVEKMLNSAHSEKYKDNNWQIARSYQDFIHIVTKNYADEKVLDFVSFGHDLSEDDSEKTGFDCAVWLTAFSVELKQSFPDFDIHSRNSSGREKMDNYIKKFYDGYYG